MTQSYRVSGPLRRLHYGPGPHPGTGSEQSVHGGEGGSAHLENFKERQLRIAQSPSGKSWEIQRFEMGRGSGKWHVTMSRFGSPEEAKRAIADAGLDPQRVEVVFPKPKPEPLGPEMAFEPVNLSEIAERHYGPGDHPGTGTPQEVHAGGEGGHASFSFSEAQNAAGMVPHKGYKLPRKVTLSSGKVVDSFIGELFTSNPRKKGSSFIGGIWRVGDDEFEVHEIDYGLSVGKLPTTFRWADLRLVNNLRLSASRSVDQYVLTDQPLSQRHYGPGDHPGTGTPQEVHAGGRGGGASRAPEADEVGRVIDALESAGQALGWTKMTIEEAGLYAREGWVGWLTPHGDLLADTEGTAHAEAARRAMQEAGIEFSEGGDWETADAYDWMLEHGFVRMMTLEGKEVGVEAHGNIGDRALSAIRQLMQALPDYELIVDSRYGEAAAKRLENAVLRHYGPGPHPGTGTEQQVHAGGAGSEARKGRKKGAAPEKKRLAAKGPLTKKEKNWRAPAWDRDQETTIVDAEASARFKKAAQAALDAFKERFGYLPAAYVVTNRDEAVAATVHAADVRKVGMEEVLRRWDRWSKQVGGFQHPGYKLLWMNDDLSAVGGFSIGSDEWRRTLWHELGHTVLDTIWPELKKRFEGGLEIENQYIAPLAAAGYEKNAVVPEYIADAVSAMVAGSPYRLDRRYDQITVPPSMLKVMPEIDRVVGEWAGFESGVDWAKAQAEARPLYPEIDDEDWAALFTTKTAPEDYVDVWFTLPNGVTEVRWMTPEEAAPYRQSETVEVAPIFADLEDEDETLKERIAAILRTFVDGVKRHYGPGPHPGTGTEQSVHAGGGGGKGTAAGKKKGYRPQPGREHRKVPEPLAPRVEREEVVKKYGQEAADLAQRLTADAHAREPSLTREMLDIGAEMKAEFMRLESRIKGEESLARKVSAFMRETGLPAAEVEKDISDRLRYTMAFTTEDYVRNVLNVQKALQARGWLPYDAAARNYWADGDDYDGYNTVYWKPATGERFELQFHTPESFERKEESWAIYNHYRELKEGDPKRSDLYQRMRNIWTNYTKPFGWERLPGMLMTPKPEEG